MLLPPVSATILAKMTRQALLILLASTVLGLAIRGWNLGRLGLVHFDEGIYATSAAALADSSAIDPGLIAYAPPAYPILVSVAFRVLGPSDTAAILVSILAATATIPLLSRLADRAFGPPAGSLAAILSAMWGGHIAFSRMALTDATFLFAWTLGLIAAARLIERPTPGRVLLAGLAIGLAQCTKYNGWLLVPVMFAAALPIRKPRGRLIAALLFSALLAALLYFPWFRFVEGHGGYKALLRHQSGYVLGILAWPHDARIQMDQVEALSGLPNWGIVGRCLLASMAMAGLLVPLPDRLRHVGTVASIIGVAAVPSIAWWIALISLQAGLIDTRPWRRVLCWSWLILAVLTPMYHPYARLWLPVQASSLVLASGMAFDRARSTKFGRSWSVAVAVAAILFLASFGRGRPLPGLLEPSDTLRTACLQASAEVLREPDRVPTLARPSVLFYLASRIRFARLADPGSARTVVGFGPSAWLLIDEIQWRQGDSGGGSIDPERWREFGRWPTPLNLPTWLDVDPSAASSPSDARDASLILYRPPRSDRSP
ncbi:MAG: glycosyltransferase family 39 protein [Isosphaeraceae bacterium]